MKCLDCETVLVNKECPKCKTFHTHNHLAISPTSQREKEIDPTHFVSGGTLIAYFVIAVIGIIPSMILATLLIYEGYDAWAGLTLIALPVIGVVLFKFLRRFAFIVFPIAVVVISLAVLENI